MIVASHSAVVVSSGNNSFAVTFIDLLPFFTTEPMTLSGVLVGAGFLKVRFSLRVMKRLSKSPSSMAARPEVSSRMAAIIPPCAIEG